MSTLERAIAIAVEAHAGQIDKAGEPYILHPLRVMLAVGPDEPSRIAAILHDVVEDCLAWPIERLRREGFAPDVIEAILAVTRVETETYEDFVLRAARSPIGRRVKLADLHDNSDMTRLADPTDRDRERLERYRRAIAALEALA